MQAPRLTDSFEAVSNWLRLQNCCESSWLLSVSWTESKFQFRKLGCILELPRSPNLRELFITKVARASRTGFPA